MNEVFTNLAKHLQARGIDLNLLLHPNRSFKEDMRTNPLSRWTWGIEPPNRKRRIWAGINVGIHPIFYILCFLLFLFRGIPPGFLLISVPPIYQAVGLKGVARISVLSALFSAPIWGMLLVMIRALNNFPARKLKANWEDYSLAGISGSQMIWGLGGNGTMGIFAGLMVYGIIFTPGLIMVGLAFGLEDVWDVLRLGCAPVIAILFCVFLDLAMWILSPGSLLRLLTVAIFGLFCSPMILSFIGLVIDFSIPLLVFEKSGGPEIFSWLIRAPIVIWLWRKAIRRLETVGPR